MSDQPETESSDRQPLKDWERTLFSIGVTLTVIGLFGAAGGSIAGATMPECPAPEASGPFGFNVLAGLFDCLDRTLGNIALGGFIGVLVGVAGAVWAVRRIRRRPPPRAVLWSVSAVVPLAILAGIINATFVQSDPQRMLDPCAQAFGGPPGVVREAGRELIGEGSIVFWNDGGICSVAGGETAAASIPDHIRDVNRYHYDMISMSADGSRLAMVARDTIVAGTTDGSSRLNEISDDPRADVPALSWDGSRVAFALRFGGKPGEIIVADADGRNPRSIIQAQGVAGIAWAPDDRSLAYIACVPNDVGGCTSADALWVAAADGTNPRLLVEGRELRSPVWSPGGDSIVYERRAWNLYSIDVATGEQRLLTKRGHSPFWSPDGSRLGYIGGSAGGIWSVTVTGGDAQRLLDHDMVGIEWIWWLDHRLPNSG